MTRRGYSKRRREVDPITAVLLGKVVVVVASGIMTILGGIVTYYLPGILGERTASIKNEKVLKLVGLAENLVEQVVTSAMQVTVDGLKKDGKFTPELGLQIKNQVFMDTRRSLLQNKDLWNGLVDYTGGEIEAWISREIERAVRNQKDCAPVLEVPPLEPPNA
jgi:hypothetical protein